MLTKKNSQQGFTVIEVGIVVPMISLVVISILAIIMNLITSMAVQSGRNAVIQDTKAALTQIESDVSVSNSFIATALPANYTDTSPPINGATYKYLGTPGSGIYTGTRNTLFLQSYNQMLNPGDATKTSTVPLLKTSAGCSGSLDTSPGNVIPVAIAYYVDSSVLYRRTITDNSGVSACGSGVIRQSCAEASSCTLKDTALLRNVESFTVTYYLSPSDTSPMDAYASSPSPTIDNAQSVLITLNSERKVTGESVVYSANVRLNKSY